MISVFCLFPLLHVSLTKVKNFSFFPSHLSFSSLTLSRNTELPTYQWYAFLCEHNKTAKSPGP